jgi:uncharacterized protein (DUF4415 family)
MMLEWDEAKRLSNIEKHGINFFDADLVFVGLFWSGRQERSTAKSASWRSARPTMCLLPRSSKDVVTRYGTSPCGEQDMKSRNVIKSFSRANLEAHRAGTRGATDLARIKAKSEAELERDIAIDPDFSDQPENWYLAAELMMPSSKKLLSLRLDSDVVEWFKQQGPGYQTRMNAVLRAFVHQAEKNRA